MIPGILFILLYVLREARVSNTACVVTYRIFFLYVYGKECTVKECT